MKLRSHFLPTEHNDYTPNLLQKVAVVPLFLLILLSFSLVNLQALFWLSSDWLVGAVLPAVIVDLTNDQRADLAQKPLQRNATLDKAATLKAEHMAKNGYFAHYSPDGVSPWYWFGEVSYQYAHAGENLAVHFSDSKAVVDAWMKSPLHRDNIVNRNYSEIGVGTARGTFDGFDTVFVVQLFGTPAATIQPQAPLPVVAKVEPVLTNVTETPVVSEIILVSEKEVVQETGFVEGEATTDVPVITSESTTNKQELDDFVADDSLATEEFAPEITNVVGTNEGVFLASSFMATSSGLLPASSLDILNNTEIPRVAAFEALATKPSTLLQALYLLIGLTVATLLILSIIVGAKHHRPMQIVYGIGLMLLMSALFYVHARLTTSVVVASEASDYSLSQYEN